MKSHVAIGTHHKSGTAWMRSVFSSLARELNVPFVHLRDKDEDEKCKTVYSAVSRHEKVIVFDYHSRFPDIVFGERFRGLHVIRDPRDMIVSAAKYHQWSEEPWLHVTRERFGGKTYQQYINSLSNFAEQLVFEMDNSAGRNIREMHQFMPRSNFIHSKYEKLILDYDMREFRTVLIYLGFENLEVEAGLAAFWQNSIFGGKRGSVEAMRHVQNGAPTQWKAVYDERLIAEFKLRFGDIAQQLGY